MKCWSAWLLTFARSLPYPVCELSAPMSSYDSFLVQQNARVAFYNEDFWKAAQFFSALALLLLSAPFGVWLKETRPADWSVITSAAPLLATVLSSVAYKLLKRTAESYYEAGASVVVLEGLLRLHHFPAENDAEIPVVTARRIEQSKKSVVDLSNDFKGRLKGVVGSSRMAVVLKLFVVYGGVAVAEVISLWLHGFWGINLVRMLRMLVGA